MLQKQPAYQGEANVVRVKKGRRAGTGMEMVNKQKEKAVRLLEQSDSAPRFGKHER